MRRQLVYLAMLMTLQSCTYSDNTAKVVTRLDNVDFSLFKGTSILFRSRGHSSNINIYFVHNNDGNCSPYVVEVDMHNFSDMKIDGDLVLDSCGTDYLEEDEIELLTKEYLALGVDMLQVDSVGNVFVNPNKVALPSLLKLSDLSSPTDFDEYVHYRGKWYISE